MDNNQGQTPRPAAQLVIKDLETLKIMSDPLRMRIVEILRRAPATVKEIAATLQVAPRSLYYHVNLLAQHNLIHVVDTRLVSGIVEKRYQATAYLFVYQDITAPTGPSGQPGLQVMISSIFDTTQQELRASLRDGLLDLDRNAPPERALHWSWRLARLSPGGVVALAARLGALIGDNDEDVTTDEAPPEGDVQTYRLLFTLFPTYYRGERPAPPRSLTGRTVTGKGDDHGRR